MRTCVGALAIKTVVLAALLSVQAPAAPRLASAFTPELLDSKTLSLAQYKRSPVISMFGTP